jgi:hypothetical protein
MQQERMLYEFCSKIFGIVACTAIDMQLLRGRRKIGAVLRQQIGKHVPPAATNTHATIELLLETVFSTRSCKGVIRKTVGATQSS